ncbi:hypothetical protein ACIRRA_34050 [Nocardia sp. NPDC101769]
MSDLAEDRASLADEFHSTQRQTAAVDCAAALGAHLWASDYGGRRAVDLT